MASLYEQYQRRSGEPDGPDLAEAYEESFGQQLEALAEVPRMVIVASRLDDATERMIDFLADTFGVPVNAVLFQPFEGGLIGRTSLRPDDTGPATGGRRSASNTASREQAQTFWDAWLDVARPVLSDIRFPKNGPRSVLIKRKIVPGLPVAITTWVSASEAYAEIQFDDDNPATNTALLTEMASHRAEVEAAFGAELDWRGLDTNGLMTKRTKIVTAKIDIGDRAKPTAEGLHGLTDATRRLIDAVAPFLGDVVDQVTSAMEDDAESEDEPEDPQSVGTDEALDPTSKLDSV